MVRMAVEERLCPHGHEQARALQSQSGRQLVKEDVPGRAEK
jgi:hypothetical protein